MAVRQQQRRGTAAQWTSANPILSPGEIGFEIDTNKFKIGDGTNRWATLTYFTADAAAALEDLIDGAPGLLNTLNELAAAVGDDANFFATVNTNIATAKSEAISTASTDATSKANAAKTAAEATASADATSKANAAQAAAEATAASALSGHEADTTNVHGIADTSIIATTTGTQTLSNKTLTTPTINGPEITATGGTPRIHGIYLPEPHFITFEGSTTDEFETVLNVVNPTQDRVVSLPDATTTLVGKDTVDTLTNKTLNSPDLTGNPTAPTQPLGNDSQRVATTAFVKAAIQDIASLDLVLDGGGV